MSTAMAGARADGGRTGRGRANLLLWTAFAFVMLAVVVGFNWDRAYHARNAFESFWSPPHLFVYATAGLAFLAAAAIGLAEPLRRAFGAAEVRLPAVPVALPGSLALLLGGFVVVGAGGTVLDQIFHNLKGLDETPWSTPHAMIGQGIFLLALGFAACHLALGGGRPLAWPIAALLGYLVFGTSFAWLGPVGRDNTPAMVDAVARIPALAAQPPAQHAFRIVRDWNLTHAGPLLVPLGALAVGASFALVRRFDRRWWVLLVAVALYSLFHLLSEHRTAAFLDRFRAGTLSPDPRNWLPMPVLPAALALLLLDRPRLPRWLPSAVAGLVFGLVAWLIWRAPHGLPLALVAAPLAALLGARAGDRLGRTLHEPTPRRVALTLAAVGVGLPLLTGLVDLALRAATP